MLLVILMYLSRAFGHFHIGRVSRDRYNWDAELLALSWRNTNISSTFDSNYIALFT